MTNDGIHKEIDGTDGVRLYFSENSGPAYWIAQMAISGGEPARVPMPSPSFRPFDVSPDGSSLLAGEVTTYVEGPLWSVPPDDQPVITRDIGSQEIFALDWQAP